MLGTRRLVNVTDTLTPIERVEEWVGLYKQFKAVRPGSPEWYDAITYMVGALVTDHIDALVNEANESN